MCPCGSPLGPFFVCGSGASALLCKELFDRNLCVESIVNGDRASGIGSLLRLIMMIMRGCMDSLDLGLLDATWSFLCCISAYLLVCREVLSCTPRIGGTQAESLLMVRFSPNIALALHPHPVNPALRRVGRRKQEERGHVGRRTVARHAPYASCYRFVPKTVWAPKPSADGMDPSLGESWAPTVHRPIPYTHGL